MLDYEKLAGAGLAPVGVVLVDHGSKREESNAQVVELARALGAAHPELLVEPAHMELAEPTLAAAFDRCVERGARVVVVHPFFLAPGSHWDRDIPDLAAEAAARHPVTPYLVTAPLGPHPLLMAIVSERIAQCLSHAALGEADCELCRNTGKCQLERR
jgi:sirohydrochlorin ferrochelatase